MVHLLFVFFIGLKGKKSAKYELTLCMTFVLFFFLFLLVCFIIGYPDSALPFFRPFPHFIHTISDHHDMP